MKRRILIALVLLAASCSKASPSDACLHARDLLQRMVGARNVSDAVHAEVQAVDADCAKLLDSGTPQASISHRRI